MITTVGRNPSRIDIEVDAGEPVDFTVPVLDGAGAAQPLSGWVLAATVRRDPASPVLDTFTATAETGGIRIYAPGEDTASWVGWPTLSAPWTLWLTPPASQPYLFAVGWVRVTPH